MLSHVVTAMNACEFLQVQELSSLAANSASSACDTSLQNSITRESLRPLQGLRIVRLLIVAPVVSHVLEHRRGDRFRVSRLFFVPKRSLAKLLSMFSTSE